jgi:hypothetical protein
MKKISQSINAERTFKKTGIAIQFHIDQASIQCKNEPKIGRLGGRFRDIRDQ